MKLFSHQMSSSFLDRTVLHLTGLINWKLKLSSHNTSYCLLEVITKAGLTVYAKFS
jgi:hypothetical protein